MVGLLLFTNMSPIPQTAKLSAIIIIKNLEPKFLINTVIFLSYLHIYQNILNSIYTNNKNKNI